MPNAKLHNFLLSQKWAVGGLLLSFVFTIALAVAYLPSAIYFNDPDHQQETLEAWMTPRYLTLSYELPRPVVLDLLGIKEGDDHPRRLDRIAENLGISLEELTQIVRAKAEDERARNID